MAIQLESKEIIKHINTSAECICSHCSGIRRQQTESEKRWVRQHQLFDR